MTLRVLLPVAALVALAIATSTSCLVDRRSGELTCVEGQTVCGTDRVCQDGYCIKAECPPECSSCDVALNSCQITCNNPNKCDTVVCPVGYACTIGCSANGACDAIDCTDGASCDITCSVGNACGPITCGDGPCDVRCTASNSCETIACGSSCKCDVACLTGNCDATTCPGADTCTSDSTPSGVCSSARADCNRCF